MIDRGPPDLSVSLPLDVHAPRAARHAVATVDRPSPDLRDAVVLLTSEVMTRAIRQVDPLGAVDLRVWMPSSIVRVEVWTTPDLLLGAPAPDEDYELLLLTELADRWSIESRDGRACIWFEIDRTPRASDSFEVDRTPDRTVKASDRTEARSRLEETKHRASPSRRAQAPALRSF